MSPRTKIREPEPVSTGSAADFIPPNPTLPKLREAARNCRGCNLWVNATQTVFGEGQSPADVMFVGEAPGDLEDRAGHPFVGPAGKLLDTAMMEAGIDRTRAYVSNSVKHFKFETAGHRRARSHGCSGAARQAVPGHSAARQADGVGACGGDHSDGAPIGGAAGSGW